MIPKKERDGRDKKNDKRKRKGEGNGEQTMWEREAESSVQLGQKLRPRHPHTTDERAELARPRRVVPYIPATLDRTPMCCKRLRVFAMPRHAYGVTSCSRNEGFSKPKLT